MFLCFAGMKVFIESRECAFHVRACFTVTGNTIPCKLVEELFNYDGYVTVSYNVGEMEGELRLTSDLENYSLPADVSELELFVNGEEAALSDTAITQKMFTVLAYANDFTIKIQQLSHPSQQFSINKKVLPTLTKAMVHTKKHLEIQQQAAGRYQFYLTRLIITYRVHAHGGPA